MVKKSQNLVNVVCERPSIWYVCILDISKVHYCALVICSLDGFTNILALRIYKTECCYLYSQNIRMNKQSQLHEKKS